MSTEMPRKAVHLFGGLTALSFPYLFSSHWTVLVLSLSFSVALLIIRRKGILRSIYNVERGSYGDIYFPAAIYLIFLLSSTKPAIYLISILVMTVSDAMAALIGGKYGVIKYDVEGNLKSLEGSFVFFFITFLCVQLPLLLLTDIGRFESVLIAFIIALLVTGFEAISLSGSDNIIVPFGTYFILAKFIRQPLNVIIWQTEILLILIVAGLMMYIRPRTLKAGGIIAIILLNYAALSLCNFYWFLPLFLAQIMYYLLILIFIHCEGKEKVASFQVKVLLYIGVLPAVFLFIANVKKDHMSVYLPYLTSITSQIAIICSFFITSFVNRILKTKEYLKRHQRALEIVGSTVATFFVAGIPILLYMPGNIYGSIITVLIGTWIAYILNFMIQKYSHPVNKDVFDYRSRLLSTAIGVASVFAIQMLVNL